MEIRRFVADTFEEACQHIKDELGPDALIISTQRLKIGGFLGLFRKKVVEVIAARVAGALLHGQTHAATPTLIDGAARMGLGTTTGGSVVLSSTGRPILSQPLGTDAATLDLEHQHTAGSIAIAPGHAPATAPAAISHVDPISDTCFTGPAPHAMVRAATTGDAAPLAASGSAPDATMDPGLAGLAGDLGLIRSELLDLRRRMDALALGCAPSATTAGSSNAVVTAACGTVPAGTSQGTVATGANPGSSPVLEPVGPAQARALQSVLDTLNRHEIEAPLLEQIRQHLLASVTAEDREKLQTLRDCVVEFLSSQVIRHEEITYTQGQKGKIIALIGPPGDGKTTTLAKLAAGFKLNMNLKVAMITVDTFRLGAPQQLQAYADIIQTPCEVVFDPAALPAVISSLTDFDVILVDTAGRNARNSVDMQDLRAFLDVGLPMEVCLVLSATTKLADSVEMAANFAQLGYSRVIMTKLDETSTFGSMLSLLGRLKKPVSYVTTGQNVPDDIVPALPQRLASLLFADGPSF